MKWLKKIVCRIDNGVDYLRFDQLSYFKVRKLPEGYVNLEESKVGFFSKRYHDCDDDNLKELYKASLLIEREIFFHENKEQFKEYLK